MSEGAVDIAEFTVMNNDTSQTTFMAQTRDLSERMTDGWRKDGGRMADAG